MVINPWNVSTNGREGNADSSIRTRCTTAAKDKILIIYKIESNQLSIPQFAKKYNLPDKFKQCLDTHKGNWETPMQ